MPQSTPQQATSQGGDRARAEYERIRQELLACPTSPDPRRPDRRSVNAQRAGRILKRKAKSFGNVATRFAYLYLTRNEESRVGVYRMARSVENANALALNLTMRCVNGLPLSEDTVLPGNAYRPIWDIDRIARALLRDLRRGRAPHDPLAEPVEGFPNLATKEAAEVATSSPPNLVKLRATVIKSTASDLERQFAGSLRDRSVLIDFGRVAEECLKAALAGIGESEKIAE